MFYIQEVAKQTNLSIHTIRFYEKEGLIKVSRDSSNYRTYDLYTVEKLLCISRLRQIGLSISDIKKYELATEHYTNPEEHQIAILEAYIAQFEQTKKELSKNIKMLKHRIHAFEAKK